PATVLFTGKLSYHANITAALYLVEDIMPLVWRERPDTWVVIAGQGPPNSILRLPGSYPGKVEVYSNVPDLRPYQWQATLAVAPLIYGVGISNKVLEALACGTPTIAARHTLSALAAREGEDLLSATDTTTWAANILTLLQRPDLRQKLSINGRAYVEKYHDWKQIARDLVAIYQETVNASQRPPSAL
ncbi:MAG: glycosyltransferase, partial [Chloroflexi bacterium]|nr:glycosyltransferase [Chloroflexota bacterium]